MTPRRPASAVLDPDPFVALPPDDPLDDPDAPRGGAAAWLVGALCVVAIAVVALVAGRAAGA